MQREMKGVGRPTQSEKETVYSEWSHSPSHLFQPGAAYIVTAGTYRKQVLFDAPAKRDFLQSCLFEQAERFRWDLQAWAIMANHYHFVAHAPENAESLKAMVTALHSKTAIWVNKGDGTPGRKVWFQYWDTCISFEKSYFARLNYVHHNPVKHGLVDRAENYPWCSMAWFQNHAEPGFQRMVLTFKWDQVKVRDDF